MPEYLSPGVYIEEVASGPVPIAGVSTSTGAMIGFAQRGPTDAPTLLTSTGDFSRIFGGPLPPGAAPNLNAGFNALAYAAEGFFQNGGTRLYVTRVAPAGATPFTVSYPLQDAPGAESLDIAAIDGGSWANPAFGFVNGRFGQTDGLRFAFAQENNAPFTTAVNAGNSGSNFTVTSSAGLYVGAVVATQTAIGPPATYDYAVVTAITGNAVTVAPALSAATIHPAGGDRVLLIEFSITVDLLAGGAVAQTETWHYLNANRATHRWVGSVLGNVTSDLAIGESLGTSASALIRAGTPTTLNFATNATRGPLDASTPTANAGTDGLTAVQPTDLHGLLSDALTLDSDDPSQRRGIYGFRNIRGMLMIAIPGITDAQIQSDLLALCENEKYKFGILDPAPVADASDWHMMDAGLNDITAQRGNVDSKYGALYYPWLEIADPAPPNPAVLGTVNLPPSGHVMGVYARVDIERGVHKAPANEVVNGIVAFSRHVDTGMQDILNPLGIDVLRDFRAENRGLRVWGARTVSSDADWKYVSIRRLFQYIEASIDYGTQWVVFEPNNEMLWARVRQSVSDFLADTWRTGALMGTKPAEAFYVVCDRTTMSQSDLENGRLIVEIGIAPTFPAEFVIFRISQWTGSAQGS